MAPKQQMLVDPSMVNETYNLKPHPVTGRLIDNHPGKRTVPMRLLVLGMPRTGTMSIFTALEKLGYKPYHMVKAMAAPRSNLTVWKEGLVAKYEGQGDKWGRAEFDKVLGSFDVVSDVPCICFAEELMAAYPEAKVLLNQRDVDRWLESMDNTVGRMMRWKSWSWVAPWDPALAKPFWEFVQVLGRDKFGTLNDFSPTSPARPAFIRHYDLVRKACVPKQRLLEYHVSQKWGPLCEFLEVPVPEEEFPRVNDAKQFILGHNVMWYIALSKMVTKIGLMVVPVVGVAWAVFQGKRFGLQLGRLWL